MVSRNSTKVWTDEVTDEYTWALREREPCTLHSQMMMSGQVLKVCYEPSACGEISNRQQYRESNYKESRMATKIVNQVGEKDQ